METSRECAPPVLYILFTLVLDYAPNLSRILAKNLGSRKTITFIACSFPFSVDDQQQRIYHRPKPISPAANANHQNAGGKTRDSKMRSPIMMATRPQRQRRLLRIRNAPRAVNSLQHMREAFSVFRYPSSLYSQNLCWALISYKRV